MLADSCWAAGTLRLVCKCVKSVKGDLSFLPKCAAGAGEPGGSTLSNPQKGLRKMR